MKCQRCSNPATVHLTDIVEQKKREAHLCEGCAREHNLLPAGPGPQLNLTALVQLLVGPATDAAAALICPACGLQYAQFRADGRLGCPHDYQEFRTELLPLLENIHGETRHVGKTPRRRPKTQSELIQLRKRLQQAVTREAYEEAAQIRDRIRHLEES